MKCSRRFAIATAAEVAARREGLLLWVSFGDVTMLFKCQPSSFYHTAPVGIPLNLQRSMKEYFAIPELCMHYNDWHGQFHSLFDGEKIRHSCFPFIKVVFQLIQRRPIWLFDADRVECFVYSALENSWISIRTNRKQPKYRIWQLTEFDDLYEAR